MAGKTTKADDPSTPQPRAPDRQVPPKAVVAAGIGAMVLATLAFIFS
jgi:hypothetical protein